MVQVYPESGVADTVSRTASALPPGVTPSPLASRREEQLSGC